MVCSDEKIDGLVNTSTYQSVRVLKDAPKTEQRLTLGLDNHASFSTTKLQQKSTPGRFSFSNPRRTVVVA